MKIALAIVVVLVFACSFFADYKWRKWMEARRRQRGAEERDKPSRM
jgi:hypothetical protein